MTWRAISGRPWQPALPNITFPADALKKSDGRNKYPEGRWERVVVKDFYQAHHKVAYALLMHALGVGERHAALQREGAAAAAPAREAEDAMWALGEAVKIIDWCVEGRVYHAASWRRAPVHWCAIAPCTGILVHPERTL